MTPLLPLPQLPRLPGHTLTPTPANSTSIQTQNLPVSPNSCEEQVDFVVNDSKEKKLIS